MRPWMTLGLLAALITSCAPAPTQSGFHIANAARGLKQTSEIIEYKIEVEGVTVAGFNNVDGLETETETVEFQDGNDRYTHKRPGKVRYSNICLKRGMVTSPKLVQWWQEAARGKNIRKSISIICLKRDGTEARIQLGEANLGTVESPLLCPFGLCFFDKPNAEYRWDKAYRLVEQGGLFVENMEIVVADEGRDGQLDQSDM